MVDAANKKRFEEAKEELHALLDEKSLREIPFIILGNKIDKQNCASREELIKELNLENLLEDEEGGRKIKLFMCSIYSSSGYNDAFKWLSTTL